MFDKLLGMHSDPKIENMRAMFPLHNYETPEILQANLGPHHEANQLIDLKLGLSGKKQDLADQLSPTNFR